MAAKSSAAEKAERELTITRIFDAPRPLVFRAWLDPRQVAEWWGPKMFTNPVCELDARPGGAIRIDMRGPDGTVYPMKGMFHEIAEPERIVFSTSALEDAAGNPQLETRNTVTFEDLGGKTKLTMRAEVVKATAAASGALAGMEAGWTQSLEKLEGFVAAAAREITATRLFDAPRELVFQTWTDPAHIGRWWGPRGFTTTTYEMDVRPGGVWRFVMHGPDGKDYQNKNVYVEVVRPERLVYDHVSAPLFRATATFVDRDGQTEVTMRMVFETAALRDKVAKEFKAVEGLSQTLDRLGEELAANAR